MFKLIVTCKKREGMPLDEFIDYYENKHLPLARDIFPPVYMHRRNYVLPDHPFYDFLSDDRATNGSTPPFDCVTEIFFETEEDARTCMSAMRDEEVRKAITADEARLYEPGGINFYVTKVYQSAIPWK